MVNQISSEEHLQPFKEKMEEFLSEGVQVVVTLQMTQSLRPFWVVGEGNGPLINDKGSHFDFSTESQASRRIIDPPYPWLAKL